MKRSLFIVVVAACGSSGPPDSAPVADVSVSDQESLCDEFVDSICAKSSFESFCDGCATGPGCAMAAGEAITRECANEITAGMVRDCATSGDLGTCARGGGCMFDAIEAVCP